MKVKSESGFSLLEVMIAITLFAFFITAFLTTQGYNVTDSENSEQQLILHSLAERTMNELIINPPRFTNATQNSKEVKKFEDSQYANFEYELEIKKLVIPDFGQLFSQGGNSEDQDNAYYSDSNRANRNTNLEKIIFDELKKNIERILWQVRITVINKENGMSYSLSSYLTDYNQKVQLNVGI
ncbi:MAG TPA: prepilin-type N-terminal cleavage/methylation domain-containing protein [Bacteriovoracaceae bacterium]|nr:prepilin-type N-terminal cleavage/methylation domain-containing protein [Bacteriovoracaceae bacterium]